MTEQETIDPSEWLHQSVDKAYPHLLRQLGATQHNGKITCSTRFAFDRLYRYPEHSPIFTAGHLSAAEFITALHDVAFRQSGYHRLKSVMADLCGVEGLAGYCPMTLYLVTVRELKPMHTHLVKRICFQELRSSDIGWVMQCAPSIRESFDELGKSIEKSLDMLKEWLENGGITKPQLRPKSGPKAIEPV